MARYCSTGIVSYRYIKIKNFLGYLLHVLSICGFDRMLSVGTAAAAS